MLATAAFMAPLPAYRTEKPYEIIGFPESEVPSDQKTNVVYETHDTVRVTDARSTDEIPSLDNHGFAWIAHRSQSLVGREQFTSIDHEHEGSVDAYLHETIAVVRETVKAKQIYVYDWRYRKNGTLYKSLDPETDPETSRYFVYAPIGNVHADYSPQGGVDKLKLHLSSQDLADIQDSGGRVRLINAWRPLKTVENAPLGVCDRRSVLQEDVIEVDKVLPGNVELESGLFYKDYHKWYYMSRQTPSELLLFVQWDGECSSQHNAAVFHASLSGTESLSGTAPRESVEVRLIVVS